MAPSLNPAPARSREPLAALSLAALGVVYGDIGTSPLYALGQCVDFVAGKTVRTGEVLGVLSLVFWALVLVVSVKYLAVILRADNQGEGGILALLALLQSRSRGGSARARDSRAAGAGAGGEVPPGQASASAEAGAAGAAAADSTRGPVGSHPVLAVLAIVGAALLYGDGAITPAISVLSAVEGLGVATDALDRIVVPLTVALLLGLFALQRFGTAGVARWFGPAMLVWFVVIGGLGLARILAQDPATTSVFAAIDPRWGASLLHSHGVRGFLVLGSVVLAITGAEALYADLGHFGPRPIRVAWSFVVFPALVLNYFGQGVLLIERGAHVRHPFFDLAPEGWLYPLIALSTVATIIASQALISGVFSLTQQAAQLGYAPRFAVVHTSSTARGQIYMPEINTVLALVCAALVLGFRSSDALASAYGIAVTGTMSVTSILFYVVARDRLGWPRWIAAPLVAAFLLVDVSFFAANLDKIASGGWLPVAIALAVFTVMTTWKRGRGLLARTQARGDRSVEELLAALAASPVARAPGTAVYLSAHPVGIPALLVHNLEANGVAHERVVIVTFASATVPVVPSAERVVVLDLGAGFARVVATFGFMETPTLDEALARAAEHGAGVDLRQAIVFVSRDTLLTSGEGDMARWRKRLFAFLWRNAPSLISTLRLRAARVVELGVQIEL